MASIVAGETKIEATTKEGKTVSFKKSKGTAAGTKTALEAAVAEAYAKGEYANPELVKALVVALHNDKTPLSLDDAQQKLQELLDNPKKRAVPAKKTEGAATAAPAPAAKPAYTYQALQKEVAAKAKAEGLFYNADAVTSARSEPTLEAAVTKALDKMRANAPAKKEAKAAAEAEKKKALLAAAFKKGLEKTAAGPAGPAGFNAAWALEVEEEHERCVAKCDREREEKLAAGRAAYTRKRAAKKEGPAGNAAPANNAGEELDVDAAWELFTADLPQKVKDFVNESKTKTILLRSGSKFYTWVGLYKTSTFKGKQELKKYQEAVIKQVTPKLPKNNNGGASRKRRASGNALLRGGSRSRKNRSRKNRNRK